MYYYSVLSIIYVHKLLKIKNPKKPKKCKTGVSNIVKSNRGNVCTEKMASKVKQDKHRESNRKKRNEKKSMTGTTIC